MKYEDAVTSVVTGDHPDPFSFLGMHPAEEDGFTVRVFLPGARTVEVLSYDGDALGELERIHPDGLFAGPVAGMVPYRLLVAWEGGGEAEVEDPYRFPPSSASRTFTSSARATTSGSTKSSGRTR